MLDFSSLFSVYESTESPPIETDDYKLVKLLFDELNHPDLLEDLFYTPFNLKQEDPIEFVDEDNSQLTSYMLTVLKNVPTVKHAVNTSSKKGYSNFISAMKKYELNTGDYMDETKEKTLAKFAYLESGYNSKASNKVSSACGYFGMINSNRKDLGSTQLYLNNTDLQFAAASRLYDQNRAALKPYYNKGKELGLSDFQMMYGFWFHPSGIISWIKNGGKDNGFRDGQGTTMTTILRKAGRMS